MYCCCRYNRKTAGVFFARCENENEGLRPAVGG